jgi:sugar transferase (PEP-CTERM/EpsH1 system associated)
MEPLLFLVHRIPFPPNKGDKIRSFHLLRYLAERYRVHLGTFVDDDADAAYAPELSALTAGHHIARLSPLWGRVRGLAGLASGQSLSVPYYRDAGLRRWVRQTVREQGIRKAVIFSSAMAQYVADLPGVQVVADFCDVDSAKWSEFARKRRWPASWLFRVEAERLLAFERSIAQRVAATTFVTGAETDLFARLAPESAPRLWTIENGVDTRVFAPDDTLESPFPGGVAPIVFTGAMDYWPNVDAVQWFAAEVLPQVHAQRPDARFYIVGMNPAPKVTALASDPRVTVTGKVPDVRPYLQHAHAVVAPLRVARGVQNKVLEAMAMARPVIATETCSAPLSARARAALVAAETPVDFARAVTAALALPTPGAANPRARQAVVDDYSWTANLSLLGELLEGRIVERASDAGTNGSGAAIVDRPVLTTWHGAQGRSA